MSKSKQEQTRAEKMAARAEQRRKAAEEARRAREEVPAPPRQPAPVRPPAENQNTRQPVAFDDVNWRRAAWAAFQLITAIMSRNGAAIGAALLALAEALGIDFTTQTREELAEAVECDSTNDQTFGTLHEPESGSSDDGNS